MNGETNHRFSSVVGLLLTVIRVSSDLHVWKREETLEDRLKGTLGDRIRRPHIDPTQPSLPP